jgi:hypothetical protein
MGTKTNGSTHSMNSFSSLIHSLFATVFPKDLNFAMFSKDLPLRYGVALHSSDETSECSLLDIYVWIDPPQMFKEMLMQFAT